MIISKAREILQDPLLPPYLQENPDFTDALKLGVEGLKRIEHVRVHPWSEIYAPLPGETIPERGIR